LNSLVSALLGGPRVGDRSPGRENNFDALRFTAALAVIVSHAFPLSLGPGTPEPLDQFTRGQMNLGTLAVDVFFVISGFLITQSFLRTASTSRFLRARVLRIFPGLAVATTFTAIVLGPLVTRLSLSQYFSDERTYTYFLTILLHNSANRMLPGVFDHNAFPNFVNGSTWTLEAEFLCYLAIAVLGTLRVLKPGVIVGLLGVAMVQPFFPLLPIGDPWLAYLDFFRYFAAGALLFLYRDSIPVNRNLALAAGTILLLSARFGRGLNSLGVVLGSYLIIWAAFSAPGRFSSWAKHGDFSYGIYIYAFPIQQAIVYFAGGTMNPLVNILLAVPLTLAAAFASWHLIEKPALALKSTTPRIRAPEIVFEPRPQ